MWANCAKKNDSCANIEKIVSTIGLIEQILMENKVDRIGAINTDLCQPQYINRMNIDNFTKKDLQYCIKVYNLLIQQMSHKNFKCMFLKMAKTYGYQISMAEHIPKAEIAHMANKCKTMIKEHQAKITTKIVTAEVEIDQNVVKLFKDQKIHLFETEIAMTKTVLMNDYAVNPAIIIPAFVEKFNNSAMHDKLDNYKWISTLKGNLSKIKHFDKFLKEDIDMASKSNVQLLKIYLAIDCLSMLTANEFKFGEKHTIYHDDLVNWAKAVMMYLQPHVETIVYAFGMQSDIKTKNLVGQDLNSQLQFINTIIEGVFEK